MNNFKEFKILKENLGFLNENLNELNILTNEQIKEGLNCLSDELLLEAKLFDWIKDKIVQSGNWLVASLKGALKSIKDLIKRISESINNFLKKSWTFLNSEISAELDKERGVITEQLKEIIQKEDKLAIENELKQFSYVIGFLSSYFTMDVSDDIYTAVNDLEKVEVDAEIEAKVVDVNGHLEESLTNLILENRQDTFFKILGDKLDNLLPFVLLKKIKNISTKLFNSFANLLSILSDSLGGPGPFKFLYIGMLLGIVVENIGESTMVLGVIELSNMFAYNSFEHLLILAIPGVLLALKVFKTISAGIWLIGSVEFILNII